MVTKTQYEIALNELMQRVCDVVIDTWEKFPCLKPEDIARAIEASVTPLQEEVVDESKVHEKKHLQ